MHTPPGVSLARSRADGVAIAYETFGSHPDEPLLLIMGIGMQMLQWHVDFCRALVERGFMVARFDNRDVGLSTHLSAATPPSVLQMLTRPAAVAPYSLDAMADDAVAVLDALGWDWRMLWAGRWAG